MVYTRLYEYWRAVRRGSWSAHARRLRFFIISQACKVHSFLEPLAGPLDAQRWHDDLNSVSAVAGAVRVLIDRAAAVCGAAVSRARAANLSGVKRWPQAALPGGVRMEMQQKISSAS
eukprot:4672697-Pyramimonas_sp.AAC.1